MVVCSFDMEIPNVSFTSLGLVVLDEIRIPCRESLTNVVGGSGAYGGFLCWYHHALIDIQATQVHSVLDYFFALRGAYA